MSFENDVPSTIDRDLNGANVDAWIAHADNNSLGRRRRRNDIELGGTADNNTLGIAIFSTGQLANRSVDICVCDNTIRNVTERAINVYQIGGRVRIEGNVITTGSVAGAAGGVAPDAIHAVGSGSYVIAHNFVKSMWPIGAGIRLHGQGWLIQRAVVLDNDVVMSPPENTTFAANTAAIEVRGFARDNIVVNNRIRGRARAALAVAAAADAAAAASGKPENNAFLMNDLQDFSTPAANIFIGPGATNTLLIEPQGSVEDHGAGTFIVK